MGNQVKNIMGCGVPALQAQAIGGFATDGLTAAGSNQGTALAIGSDVNVITTTASSTGVILPANPAPGDEIIVANLGANALSVYPASGGAIQNGATNAAFSVGAAKTAKFIARPGSSSWIAILSA